MNGRAAEVFRVGEEVLVGVHRLGDGGMTESGLNHLGVQVGSDFRRAQLPSRLPPLESAWVPAGSLSAWSGLSLGFGGVALPAA